MYSFICNQSFFELNTVHMQAVYFKFITLLVLFKFVEYMPVTARCCQFYQGLQNYGHKFCILFWTFSDDTTLFTI